MTRRRADFIRYALWLVLGAAIGWFIVETIAYLPEREPPPSETLLNRGLWFYGHAALALPILLIGPLQFSSRLRRSRPGFHRALGKTYLVMSLITAALALWLGLTIEGEGRQIPLAMFALVWIGFSLAAWAAARRRDITVHRAFVVRGFALALAFVWIRLIGYFEDTLFPFIESGNVRDVSAEWLSFVVPMLVVEAWLVWWPSVRGHRSRGLATTAAPR